MSSPKNVDTGSYALQRVTQTNFSVVWPYSTQCLAHEATVLESDMYTPNLLVQMCVPPLSVIGGLSMGVPLGT